MHHPDHHLRRGELPVVDVIGMRSVPCWILQRRVRVSIVHELRRRLLLARWVKQLHGLRLWDNC